MNLDTVAKVENMTHKELREEYEEIGDELFYQMPVKDETRDAMYERRIELWKEMKSRVSTNPPHCPKCNNKSWAQTPGDPKTCTTCDFEPRRTELIEKIDDYWETILGGESND